MLYLEVPHCPVLIISITWIISSLWILSRKVSECLIYREIPNHKYWNLLCTFEYSYQPRRFTFFPFRAASNSDSLLFQDSVNNCPNRLIPVHKRVLKFEMNEFGANQDKLISNPAKNTAKQKENSVSFKVKSFLSAVSKRVLDLASESRDSKHVGMNESAVQNDPDWRFLSERVRATTTRVANIASSKKEKIYVYSSKQFELLLKQGFHVSQLEIRGRSQPWRQDRTGALIPNNSSAARTLRGDGRAMQLEHPVLGAIWQRARSGSKPGKRTDDLKIGLAIEGGGLRGCITAGFSPRISWILDLGQI